MSILRLGVGAFALVLYGCTSTVDETQSDSSAGLVLSPPPERTIARSDSLVASIDSTAPSLRRFTRDLTGMSTEGGTLDAYGSEGVARGGVRKMVVTHLGETGRVVQRFYYEGFAPESLVFVGEVRERYDRPLSGTTVERVAEGYYLSAGRLLGWRDSTGQVSTSFGEEVRARGESLQALGDQLLRCASGRRTSDCAAGRDSTAR